MNADRKVPIRTMANGASSRCRMPIRRWFPTRSRSRRQYDNFLMASPTGSPTGRTRSRTRGLRRQPRVAADRPAGLCAAPGGRRRCAKGRSAAAADGRWRNPRGRWHSDRARGPRAVAVAGRAAAAAPTSRRWRPRSTSTRGGRRGGLPARRAHAQLPRLPQVAPEAERRVEMATTRRCPACSRSSRCRRASRSGGTPRRAPARRSSRPDFFSGLLDQPTRRRAPFPGLNQDEKIRHKGELVYPNFLLSLSADHVAAFTLWPEGPLRTSDRLRLPLPPGRDGQGRFDPSDAVEFWDLVNRQDWDDLRGRAGRDARPGVFEHGYYAPMESWSLDIRRYIREHLGRHLPA